MKKWSVLLLKILLSVGILAFLIHQAVCTTDAEGNSIFARLLENEKDWTKLGWGFLFSFLAVLLTITRWWWLVRLQGIPARWTDTLRIGYIGYLFNLAPMGIVGGDLLKVWLLARQEKENPSAPAVILASAFLDRMIGLYALFLMAGIAVLAMGVLTDPQTSTVLSTISIAVLGTCGFGTVAGLIVLLPRIREKDSDVVSSSTTSSKWVRLMRECVLSVRLYRRFPLALVGILATSLLVHTLFALSIFFLAQGIWQTTPTLAQHLYLSPTSMSTSAIPLPFGPYEAVLDLLYQDVLKQPGVGLVVALTYRVVCLVIASLGVVFYFTARNEIRETVAEHQET